MKRWLPVAFVCLATVACTTTSVTPQRLREAKLMPTEVAYEVVDKYTSKGWSRSPAMYPELVNHPACGNRAPRPVQLSQLQVLAWHEKGLVLYQRRGADFWCGTNLIAEIKTNSIEGTEDLLDALASLGVQIKVQEK